MFKRSEGAEFKLRRKHKKSITASPLFVLALTLWGAALAGLAVFVLPQATIQQIADVSALTVLGGLARIVFAVIAGALGAAIMYFVALGIRGTMTNASEEITEPAARSVRTINPAAELGSESLDSPIDEDEFEDEYAQDEPEFEQDAYAETDAMDALSDEDSFMDLDPEWVEDMRSETQEPADIAEDDPEIDAIQAPAFHDEYVEEVERDAFVERDSDEEPSGRKVELVQALNGHLARKAEEANALAREKDRVAKAEAFAPPAEQAADSVDPDASVEAQTAEPVRAPNPAPPQSKTAADKLRTVPAHELSLVQMVERFALALHENQRAARIAREAQTSAPRRDTELADALKTLAKYTDSGFDDEPETVAIEADGETEREMRDALAKLQSLRGAA